MSDTSSNSESGSPASTAPAVPLHALVGITLERRWIVVAAIVGLVLGILALLWPGSPPS